MPTPYPVCITHTVLLCVLVLCICCAAVAQSCITGEVICEKGSTYCASNGICKQLSLKPLVRTKQKPATKGKTGYSFVMFSDIQWYFVICKEAPLSECIYNNFDGSRPQRRALLDAAAARQGACVSSLAKNLKDVKAVLHNGDITNRGLPNEVETMEQFHEELQMNLSMSQPLLIALGNHDYFLGDEEASVRVISYFQTALMSFAGRTKLRNIDFNSSSVVYNSYTKRNEKYTRGSLCFSVEYNGYVFIILNWATALRTGDFTPQFESFDERNNATHFIDITSVTDWLVDELQNAKKKKRKVVLVPHAWKGLRLFTNRVQGMSDILYDSSVIAVLSGHVHDAYGFDNDWLIGSGTNTRPVPVYYAGSASYNKLIAIRMKARKKGLIVDVYDTKEIPCVKTNSASTQYD